MPFRFALEAVLRLRRGQENQEEKKLAAIVSALNRVKTQMEHLDAFDLAQRRKEKEELASNFALGAQLQFQAACENRRRVLRKELAEKLAVIERQRVEQIGRYRLARQKREILEGLREHQKTAYESQAVKREQQRTDEAFLIRLMQTERD